LGERVLNAYEAGQLHPVGSSAIHGRAPDATESLRSPHRRRGRVWIFSSLKETMGRFLMPPDTGREYTPQIKPKFVLTSDMKRKWLKKTTTTIVVIMS
jgi:hypothetical protein